MLSEIQVAKPDLMCEFNLSDIQGCLEGSCFEGVACLDVPAPGTGFSCGPCPSGYHGDGAHVFLLGSL